ncbi:hypothetical protein CDAR_301951 [Caerostris darwini]|uniref:Uncharacterized protein n=1 Tax=Caerostris darwini TaxID=1538125 RepID=A0AAV4UHI9_9ARAC|nr:hypothetical protein CDAR_301951 [Caerostris darwini]
MINLKCTKYQTFSIQTIQPKLAQSHSANTPYLPNKSSISYSTHNTRFYVCRINVPPSQNRRSCNYHWGSAEEKISGISTSREARLSFIGDGAPLETDDGASTSSWDSPPMQWGRFRRVNMLVKVGSGQEIFPEINSRLQLPKQTALQLSLGQCGGKISGISTSREARLAFIGNGAPLETDDGASPFLGALT